MSYVSVTNTFTNGTTADATEVNANFSDIINGLSDGTKDINMNSAAFAGTLSCNGAATLGNGVGDDITISGSLAATLNIKTTHLYDFGSATIGIRDIYFGSSGGAFTTKLSGYDVAASKTVVLPGFDLSFPTADGVNGAALVTNGSGASSFLDINGPALMANYSLTASVGSNALTIGLTGSGGTALSASNKASFSIRNATITTGQYSTLNATSDLSLVISSGSTLGHISAATCYIYIYVINDAGTLSIGASSQRLREDIVHTSVAEGGAGAADSDSALYSTAAHVGCAIKCIGYMKSSQATAGTWASAISNIYCGLVKHPVINAEAANYTIGNADEADIWMITTGSSANVEVTLPDCATNNGRILEICKVDTGTKFVEIKRAGTDTIRGSATSIYAITQYESIRLIARGTDWVLLGDPIRSVTATITNSGTPTVSTQSATWISSLTDNDTGYFTININTGVFLSNVCFTGVNDNNSTIRGVWSTNDVPTASALVVITYRSTTEATVDTDFYVVATGKK